MEYEMPESGSAGEKELVESLKRGEPGAIDPLMERYSGPLFAFIMRMICNRAVSEDIFQETWVRVIRKIGTFRGDSKFSTWLFQIALNLCRNEMRRSSRRSFVELDDAPELMVEAEADGEKYMLAARVKKLIASLPPKMREVIVLRYYHDKTDNEIAEVTGLPPGTVKSRLFRATGMLKEKIERAGLTVLAEEVE